MDKYTAFRYDLFVNGLWGRNRKPKFEVFSVLRRSVDKLSPDDAMQRMKDLARALKVKPGARLTLKQSQILVTQEENGTVFETWEPMNPEHNQTIFQGFWA